jgi:hypothetical protein
MRSQAGDIGKWTAPVTGAADRIACRTVGPPGPMTVAGPALGDAVERNVARTLRHTEFRVNTAASTPGRGRDRSFREKQYTEEADDDERAAPVGG